MFLRKIKELKLSSFDSKHFALTGARVFVRASEKGCSDFDVMKMKTNLSLVQKNQSTAWPVLALLMLIAGKAFAVDAPNAGALLRQIQGNQAVPGNAVQPSQNSAGNKPRAEHDQSQQQKVLIKSIKVEGSTLLNEQDAQAIVESWVGQSWSYDELTQVLDALSGAYKKAGRLARIYFPQQDITDGDLRIAVVESTFGGLKIDDQSVRIDKSWLNKYLAANFPAEGGLVSTSALERAVLLANEVPGIEVKGNLAAGSKESQTDLVVSIADKPVLSGVAMLDNSGQRSTGSTRLAAVLNAKGALGIGDQFDLTAMKTQGLNYGRLDAWFTQPGVPGLKVGAAASYMDYKIISGDQVINQPAGTATTFALQSSYAIVRGRGEQMSLNSSLEHKKLYNTNISGVSSEYAISALNNQVVGFFNDAFLDGAINSYYVGLGLGQVNLNGSPNQLADASSAKTEGTYKKLSYGFTRQQYIGEQFLLSAQFSGQWANKNLDASEKFYIGGPASVRAYPSSEAGGATGQLLVLDYKYLMDSTKSIGVFYDYGWVKANVTTWDSSVNKIILKDVGLAGQWSPSSATTLKASVAWRIGRNPNPTDAGTDRDGTLINPRVWVEMNHNF